MSAGSNLQGNTHSQLHLDLQRPTQTFKRSFQQYGFDADSPTSSGASGSETSSIGGGERNKRVRSEGSSPLNSGSSSSLLQSTLVSSSSTTSSTLSSYRSAQENNANDSHMSFGQSVSSFGSGLSLTRPDILSGNSIPLIESHVSSPPIIDDDISLLDPEPSSDFSNNMNRPWSPLQAFGLPEVAPSSGVESALRNSLERYREFDQHISALRRSPEISHVHSRGSSSLRLPPLALYDDSTTSGPPSPLLNAIRQGDRPLSSFSASSGPFLRHSASDLEAQDNMYTDGTLLRPEANSDLEENRARLLHDMANPEDAPGLRFRLPQQHLTTSLNSRGNAFPQPRSYGPFSIPFGPRSLQSRPPPPILPSSDTMTLPPDIQPPTLSEEEENRSLREHTESLLEGIHSQPILPLSFPSYRDEDSFLRRHVEELGDRRNVEDLRDRRNVHLQPRNNISENSTPSYAREMHRRLIEARYGNRDDTDLLFTRRSSNFSESSLAERRNLISEESFTDSIGPPRSRRPFPPSSSRRLWDHLHDAAPHIRFPGLPESNSNRPIVDRIRASWDNAETRADSAGPAISHPQIERGINSPFRNTTETQDRQFRDDTVTDTRDIDILSDSLSSDDDEHLSMSANDRVWQSVRRSNLTSHSNGGASRFPPLNNGGNDRNRFLTDAVREVLSRHDASAQSRYRASQSHPHDDPGMRPQQPAHQRLLQAARSSNPWRSHSPASGRQSISEVAESLRLSLPSPRNTYVDAFADVAPDVPTDVPSSSEAAAFFASGTDSTVPTNRPSLHAMRQRRPIPADMSHDPIPGLDFRPYSPNTTIGVDPFNISGMERTSSTEGVTRTSLSVPRPSFLSNRSSEAPATSEPYTSRRTSRSSMQSVSSLWAPPRAADRSRPFSERTSDEDWLHQTIRNSASDSHVAAGRQPLSRSHSRFEGSRDVHDFMTRRIRPPPEDRHEEPDTPSTRSHSLQQALDVMRGDGLSPARQQQFQAAYQHAYEHARTRDRSRARWGDIEDEDNSRGLSGFGEALRRRQNASLNLPRVAPEREPPSIRRAGNAAARQSPTPPRDGTEGDHSMGGPYMARRIARQRRNVRMLRLGDWEFSPFDTVYIPNSPNGMVRGARRVRNAGRSLGDYVRDEDFDPSYESLVALAAALGDAKPRATPSHVIASLPTAFYKDWKNADSDTRCPICLDDYKPLDPVLKLDTCKHWFHKECLEQWLHGARTCPVCRDRIKITSSHTRSSDAGTTAGPSGTNHDNLDDENDDSDSDFSVIGDVIPGFD